MRNAIAVHARNCAPEECCGLLAFDDADTVSFAYPLTNADHSLVSYTVDPAESYHAFIHAEKMGWSIGGAFHSHPRGPDELSKTDIDEAIPGWVYILESPNGLSGWRFIGSRPQRMQLT